jgi:glycosyltransferase involved in cell wall biosynthesis
VRILQLNRHGARVGGAEGYIAEVSKALEAAGHETRLISLAPESVVDLLPGTVQVVAPSLHATQTGIETEIERFCPDAAYVHAVYDPRLVRWLMERVPILAYVHGPYLVCPGSGQYLRRSMQVCWMRAGLSCLWNARTEGCCFGRNPMRHFEALRRVYEFMEVYSRLSILVGSEFMRGLLIRNGIPDANISILPPVLLANQLPQPAASLDSKNLLFAGRLVPEKGLSVLIQALSQVSGEWKLRIAGDGPERSHCEESARQLGLGRRIEFLGWRSETEMTDLYKQCAFVVAPSLWPEPFGRIGPEAASHGRTTVAFDVGGVQTWLDHGETGYLAPFNDVSALAAAAQKLLDDPEQCRRAGQRAFAVACARWNQSRHVDILTNALLKAIAPTRGET